MKIGNTPAPSGIAPTGAATTSSRPAGEGNAVQGTTASAKADGSATGGSGDSAWVAQSASTSKNRSEALQVHSMALLLALSSQGSLAENSTVVYTPTPTPNAQM